MGSESDMTILKMMNQDFVKLDRFDETNFTRWKDKLMFLLTTLKISYVLDPNLPKLPEPETDEDAQRKVERKKREEDEVVCRGHILNTLSDRLYDLFTSIKSPREIWEALEFKYKTEKQGTDKFLIMKFFEFTMVDNIFIMDQVHELQVLVNKLRDLKVDVSEPLQVGAIIAKLPLNWNDYRKKLIHTIEDFIIEQIQKHFLRIEEETRIRDKNLFFPSSSKVNIVGEKNKFQNNHGGNKRKYNDFSNNSSNNNKFKKNKTCYNCRKNGHLKRECRYKKKQKKEDTKVSNSANLTKNETFEIIVMISEMIVMISEMHISMITELHMAASTKSSGWWYDSGAIVHVCNNKTVGTVSGMVMCRLVLRQSNSSLGSAKNNKRLVGGTNFAHSDN